MRYWILTTEPRPQRGGGIGTYVQEMSHALSQNGHEVTVIAVNLSLGKPLSNTTSDHRLVEFEPSAWNRGVHLGGSAGASWAFSNLLPFLIRTLGEPDVLEVQDYGGLAYFTLQRQWCREPGFPRVPVVVRVHGPRFALRESTLGPEFSLPSFWFAEMEQFCLEAAALVLSPSEAMDRALRRAGISAALHRARNPLRLPVPETPAHEDDQGDIVFYSRMSATKGIVELLDAFARRCAVGHTDRLVVVGADSYYLPRDQGMRAYLTRRHQHLVDAGLIEFRGGLPRDEALEIVASARAVLMPSLFESFSYATCEAMALQRVVLVGGGAPGDYVEDGISGIVCDPAAPASLDEGLERVLALSSVDRRAIGEAARSVAAEVCDPDSAVAELNAALSHVRPPGSEAVFPTVRARPLKPAPPHGTTQDGLLSVVIPCHNLGEFVGEAVASVVNSHYRPIELIVIDDGSTDADTASALDALAVGSDDPSITLRVERRPNAGLARTRNLGADLATGEYLAFLDADDAVEPSYFSRSVSLLEHHSNIGFVGCWLARFGRGQGSWVTWNTGFPYLLFHNMINSAGIVIRRSVFNAHGRNNPDLFTGLEDYDSVIRMAAAGWAGVAIPERLFRYRIRDDSMMRSFTLANRMLMYERIAAASPDLVAEHAVSLAGLLNANGPGWATDDPTSIAVGRVLSRAALGTSAPPDSQPSPHDPLSDASRD